MEELKNYYKAILKEVTAHEFVSKHGPEKGLDFIKRNVARITSATSGDRNRQIEMLKQLGVQNAEYLPSRLFKQNMTDSQVNIDINNPEAQAKARNRATGNPNASGMRMGPLSIAGRFAKMERQKEANFIKTGKITY